MRNVLIFEGPSNWNNGRTKIYVDPNTIVLLSEGPKEVYKIDGVYKEVTDIVIENGGFRVFGNIDDVYKFIELGL